MRFAVVGAALAVSLALAAPAAAALQLVAFTGTAFVAPSGTPIAALNDFALGQVSGAFFIDTAAATLQLTGPVGGQGEGALLIGAVDYGSIFINGVNGPINLISNANDAGIIFTVNNGGVPGNPGNRIDQTGYSTGSRVVAGSIVKPYDIVGPLPSDVFFGSLFFGRTLQGPVGNPPALITDVTTRDFGGVLTGPIGSTPFLSITFRQGNPNGAVLAGLPLQALSVGNIQLSITNIGGAVPEPSNWALLIIGFGLTGAALRRRRAVAA